MLEIQIARSAASNHITNYLVHIFQLIVTSPKICLCPTNLEEDANDLKNVFNKLILDSMGQDIEKPCQSIYSFHDILVRKVKILTKSKFELGKMEFHGKGGSSLSN